MSSEPERIRLPHREPQEVSGITYKPAEFTGAVMVPIPPDVLAWLLAECEPRIVRKSQK